MFYKSFSAEMKNGAKEFKCLKSSLYATRDASLRKGNTFESTRTSICPYVVNEPKQTVINIYSLSFTCILTKH